MTGKRPENVLEIRAYIKGRSLLGIKAVDIHREVCDIYGEGQMSHRTVCRWVVKFSAGQQQLKYASRPVRPATTTTKGDIEKKPRNILKTDARFTVRQLARMKNLSLARVHANLKKHLKVRKINGRWIPHLLTAEQKKTQKNFSKCTQNIVKRLLII